jgi:hypothetical protein
LRRSAPARGVRVVTNVERNAVDASCVVRRAARSRTAKSCGPGAPMQALSPSEAESFAKATVANAGSPGRARISCKTTAQGRPVVTACTCGFRARANFLCAGAPGAAATRPSLCPLHFTRAMDQAKLGRIPLRERRVMSRSRYCEPTGPGLFGLPDDRQRCLKFESERLHVVLLANASTTETAALPYLRFALPANGNATPVLISFKIMLVRTWRMPGRRNMKLSRKSL